MTTVTSHPTPSPSLQLMSLGRRRRRRNHHHQSPLSGKTCNRGPFTKCVQVNVVDVLVTSQTGFIGRPLLLWVGLRRRRSFHVREARK